MGSESSFVFAVGIINMNLIWMESFFVYKYYYFTTCFGIKLFFFILTINHYINVIFIILILIPTPNLDIQGIQHLTQQQKQWRAASMRSLRVTPSIYWSRAMGVNWYLEWAWFDVSNGRMLMFRIREWSNVLNMGVV